MATSNDTEFDLKIDEVIKEAVDLLGGSPYSGEDLRKGRAQLNLLQRELINRSVPLGLLERKPVSVVAGTTDYLLTDDVNDVLAANVVVENSNIPLKRISEIEYFQLVNTTQTSRPTQYTIERRISRTNLRIWPKPDKAYTVNVFTFLKPDDVISYEETLSVQPRYLPAIIYGLAYKMSFIRGAENISPQYRQELKLAYEESLAAAFNEDRERTSLIIQPKIRRRR